MNPIVIAPTTLMKLAPVEYIEHAARAKYMLDGTREFMANYYAAKAMAEPA